MTTESIRQASGGDAGPAALIELDQVTKIYQTNDGPVESLKPLSFDIREGEFVSVVGPSGCGKSPLLKLVAGLLPGASVRWS